MRRTLAILLFASVLATPAFAADPPRFAKVIGLSGDVSAIKPDGSKVAVKMGDEYPAKSVLKSGPNSSLTLFFRRIGTIVQLQEDTSLSLDKLEMRMMGDNWIKETELGMENGSILACVRVLIPDSKVIVKTPKATFRAPGTGMGRYEMRADGSALVGRRSKLTLEVKMDGDPIKVMPGQSFDAKMKSAVQAHPTAFERFTPRMDQLQKTAHELTPPPAPEDLP